jgi:hypothetical protein
MAHDPKSGRMKQAFLKSIDKLSWKSDEQWISEVFKYWDHLIWYLHFLVAKDFKKDYKVKCKTGIALCPIDFIWNNINIQ